jgi:hypothetical protein
MGAAAEDPIGQKREAGRMERTSRHLFIQQVGGEIVARLFAFDYRNVDAVQQIEDEMLRIISDRPAFLIIDVSAVIRFEANLRGKLVRTSLA